MICVSWIYLASGCVAVAHINDHNWKGHSKETWDNESLVEGGLGSETDRVQVFTAWNSTDSQNAIIPFWAKVSQLPPYSVGIRAWTYDEKWSSLELVSLILVQGDREFKPLDNSMPVIEKFFGSVDGTSYHADCLVDIGTWPEDKPGHPVTMRVKYILRKDTKVIKGNMTAKLDYQHIKEFRWFAIGGYFQ